MPEADVPTAAAARALARLRWLSLVAPLLMALLLLSPWLARAAGVPVPDGGIARDALHRLFAAPSAYLPVSLAYGAVLALTLWPGPSRFVRGVFGSGVIVGLAAATAWAFDGGLGNGLLAAGFSLLGFATSGHGGRRARHEASSA